MKFTSKDKLSVDKMLKTWSLFTASVIVSEFTAALFINGRFQQGYPKTLLDILKSTFGCCLIHNVSPQQVAPGVVFGWFFFPCWMPLLTQSQRNRTVDLCLLGECVNHYTIKLTSTKKITPGLDHYDLQRYNTNSAVFIPSSWHITSHISAADRQSHGPSPH